MKTLHPDTLAFVAHHPWPGNVRELENVIHREFLLGDDSVLRIAPVLREDGQAMRTHRFDALTSLGFRAAKAQMIADFERAYLVELLSRTHGNLSRAAALSGKERSRLGRLVRKYGLTRDQFTHSA